jgi:hypothetical protein
MFGDAARKTPGGLKSSNGNEHQPVLPRPRSIAAMQRPEWLSWAATDNGLNTGSQPTRT